MHINGWCICINGWCICISHVTHVNESRHMSHVTLQHTTTPALLAFLVSCACYMCKQVCVRVSVCIYQNYTFQLLVCVSYHLPKPSCSSLTMQHTATQFNIPQHTAIYCNSQLFIVFRTALQGHGIVLSSLQLSVLEKTTLEMVIAKEIGTINVPFQISFRSIHWKEPWQHFVSDSDVHSHIHFEPHEILLIA